LNICVTDRLFIRITEWYLFYFFTFYGMKKLLALFVGMMALGFTFAAWTTDSKMADVQWMPPIENTAPQYSFDEAEVKDLVTQKNILLQLKCNGLTILQSLGFWSAATKIFTVGLTEGDYEYTFDVRNCSLRANKSNANYNYIKSITEQEALALADAFMKTNYLKDKVFNQVGKPIIVYKNSNGPYYPLMKADSSSSSVTLPGIEIDEDDVEDVYPEYTSYSIMYPYIINGQEIWEQYGNRAGIQLEVSSDGVMSVNARLLPFKAARRNSDKVSGDDAVRILENWGNTPFYGQTKEITFKKPEKVLVMFNIWKDNKTYMYLSSWIGLKSDVKADQRAQQPYTMILSDYKIWNTAQ